jgi:GntR family transcriptional regulator/MocR family aminotransferase
LPKTIGCYELTLSPRPQGQTLTSWLYVELRGAILQRRLAPGTRLPASRDFATQHGLSRGTVVSVFERLQTEGYVSCQVGSGTWVNRLATVKAAGTRQTTPPAYIRRLVSAYTRPKAWVDIVVREGARPFQMRDPAIAEFPAKVWGSIAARRARTFASWLKTEDDGRGYRPLREAIAHYLAMSRGVRCGPDQVIVVSGVQQGLDLLAARSPEPG